MIDQETYNNEIKTKNRRKKNTSKIENKHDKSLVSIQYQKACCKGSRSIIIIIAFRIYIFGCTTYT